MKKFTLILCTLFLAAPIAIQKLEPSPIYSEGHGAGNGDNKEAIE